MPPKSDRNLYEKHVESVFEICSSSLDSEITIFGDNIPNSFWRCKDGSLEIDCLDS